MGDPERYPGFRHSLQGQIALVRGNHDHAKIENVLKRMDFAETTIANKTQMA